MRTTWDRHRQPGDHDDPYASYGAWERWMEAEDEKDYERGSTLPPVMAMFDDDISARINLYSRFCDAATGHGLPWHVRLWDVLTEPAVRAWWRRRRWWSNAAGDTRWFLGRWRAGMRPRYDGKGWYVARDPATGEVDSCRSMWWDRVVLFGRGWRLKRARMAELRRAATEREGAESPITN